MTDVTRILNAIEQGNSQAIDELLPLVYEELRVLAAQRLSQEPPGQTLQATALVHEAYIRLVGAECRNWSGRNHFFMAAAEAMRRILIESARRKKSLKHGGGHRRVGFDAAAAAPGGNPEELIALDDALAKLAAEDPAKVDLVKLRYFAGLSIDQASEVLGISRATAIRHWSFARAWLFDYIGKDG
ncbi:MAG: sigma-70 family RNA polymerase sigma factor [Phycisphaerales bacterium]|nr:MAG: sigma-70 family RNA polymerase sigma factor [Phycisphaerales bacterium]